MISSFGPRPVRSRTASAARAIARTCISYTSGSITPSRTPRVSEHRVGLLERTRPIELALESRETRAAVDPRAHDLLVQLEAVGQELVQRRVEQANRHRPAHHRLEQPLEVALLERQQLVQRGPPAGLVARP